jgi:hypothetical protein
MLKQIWTYMANFRRKRTKKQPKCTICTKYNWLGNNKNRVPHKDKKHDNKD